MFIMHTYEIFFKYVGLLEIPNSYEKLLFVQTENILKILRSSICLLLKYGICITFSPSFGEST